MTKLKNIVFIITIMLLTTLFYGCVNIKISISDTTNAKLVSELINKADNTVYIRENEEYQPYLVISNDYEGQTLLLRKFVIDEVVRYSNDPLANANGSMSSYYPDNATDKYMNNEFLSRFSDNFKKEINDTPIKVASYDGIYNADSFAEPEVINRKIFSLSASEVMKSRGLTYANEGKFLDYFDKEDALIAYKSDNTAQGYWLRSAYFWNDNLAVGVGDNGKYAGELTALEMSLRPSFTVKPELEVSYIDGEIDGQKICVFAVDK